MSLSYEVIKLSNNPSWIKKSAKWFSAKWNISYELYMESMKDSLTNTIPQWYIVIHKDRIIGGCGIIENDFHPRKDLTPNLCALYVEEEYRNKKVATNLLKVVCKDRKEQGIKVLYLLTKHTSFYERLGWKFLCNVQAQGEDHLSRMYIYETQ